MAKVLSFITGRKAEVENRKIFMSWCCWWNKDFHHFFYLLFRYVARLIFSVHTHTTVRNHPYLAGDKRRREKKRLYHSWSVALSYIKVDEIIFQVEGSDSWTHRCINTYRIKISWKFSFICLGILATLHRLLSNFFSCPRLPLLPLRPALCVSLYVHSRKKYTFVSCVVGKYEFWFDNIITDSQTIHDKRQWWVT